MSAGSVGEEFEEPYGGGVEEGAGAVSGAQPKPSAAPQGDTLRGLGPVSRSWLADMGVHTTNDLQSVDVFDLYRQLKQHHSGVSRNLLYALIGA